MKRQSIYVDPEELKKKNQDEPAEQPGLGLTDVVRTSRSAKQPHGSAHKEIPMTKEEIIEIAKDAYEEGLKDAKKQPPKHAKAQQQPAAEKPQEEKQENPQQEAQPKEEPQQEQQRAESQKAAPQNEEPQKDTSSQQESQHPDSSGSKGRQKSSMKPSNGESITEKKKQMKDKMPANDRRSESSNSSQKSSGQQGEEPQEQLETIVHRNNYVIFEAKSIWPIDMFPDTIIVDMTKISIIHKTFFATEHVTAIPLQSVADIFLQTTFLSAALTIKYLLRTDRPGIIEPVETKILALHRDEAITAKNIIRGLILANEENIDLTKLKIEDLRGKLEELGATKTGV